MSIDAGADRERTTLPEKMAWILFCLTCLQIVLLKSFVKVAAGLKADVFSAVLCAITLAACLLTARRSSIRASIPEVLVSMALLGLAALSGVVSSTPWSSSVWAFCMASYCLGGFWCARIVLNSRLRQGVFVWACSIGLSLLLCLSLWGYYFHGVSQYFVDDLHQLVNVVLLLLFSPLALLVHRRILVRILGAMSLAGCYAALYISGLGGVELGVLIPMAMLIPAFFITMARPGSRYALLVVLLIVAAVTAHYVTRISSENFSGSQYQAERLEFYTFSLHVAEKHPFLGIGLRAPRDEALADYRVWHPNFTDKQFAAEVKRLVTSQNMFLTFMVGFGVPFALLYLAALGVLYGRLTRTTWRPPPEQVVPPMALLIPVTGCILHFLTMDIMLMPQVAWFFHVLLGMIPASAKAPAEEIRRVSLRYALGAAGATLATLVLGILVGTHPALAPARMPSMEQVRDYLAKMPLVAPIVSARKIPERQEIKPMGSLMINILDYEPVRGKCRVLFLLDNSRSMAKQSDPWTPDRFSAGLNFIELVGRAMPEGDRMGIRSFATSGPFKKGGREFSPRVSSLILAWQDTPLKGVSLELAEHIPPGPNNLCAALQFSAGRDFMFQEEGFSLRIAVVTDGSGACPLGQVIQDITARAGDRPRPAIDLVAIGMSEQTRTELGAVVDGTEGFLMAINRPEDAASAAKRYVKALSVSGPKPILVVGADSRLEVLPGRPITLPAGPYTLKLPEHTGITTGSQVPVEVSVSAGETSVFDVSIREGKVTVKKREEKPDESR